MNYLLLSFSVSHRVCHKLCSDSCTMFSWACCWLAFWTLNGERQRPSEYNFHFHLQVHSSFKNLLPESKLWRCQKKEKKKKRWRLPFMLVLHLSRGRAKAVRRQLWTDSPPAQRVCCHTASLWATLTRAVDGPSASHREEQSYNIQRALKQRISDLWFIFFPCFSHCHSLPYLSQLVWRLGQSNPDWLGHAAEILEDCTTIRLWWVLTPNWHFCETII